MQMHQELTTNPVPPMTTRHHYRLQFHGNHRGVDKAMEFYAPSTDDALEFVLTDPARRTVEIWEDDEFILIVSPDAPGGWSGSA